MKDNLHYWEIIETRQTLSLFTAQDEATEMSDYIRERSSGEIIRDSFRIYRRHFRHIFLIYFANAFIYKFVYDLLEPTGWTTLKLIFQILRHLMPYVAGLQLMLLVSQIYLGYELNLSRVFMRSSILLGKALVTGLLVLVLFFLYPFLMFSVPVVMLEGVWGFSALRRSVELGRDYHLRNFFVYVWPYANYLLVYLALGIVFTSYEATAEHWWVFFSIIKDFVFSLLFAPLLTIAVVLLYYDMRIRNEAYDIVSLAEELKQ